MSSLTGRYTGSPESQFEFDLTRLRGLRGSEAFVGELETIGSETLTNDFWTITLPADLATSSPRSPSMLAFYAALIVLDAPALYSDRSVRDLADPAVRGPRRPLERHHLFPKAYLAGLGIDDPRDYNQIANFTVIEWGDNIALAAQAPADYAPAMEARVAAHRLPEMYRLHALPDGWAMMDFSTFLRARRTLMARTIRAGFDALAGETRARPHKPSVAEIVAAGETGAVEFKSTLRTNLHTGQHDPRMEMAVLKTIAGFLNSGGGRLVIGIADDGTPIGLDPDRFPSEDRMVLHLVNLLRDRLGAQYAMYIEPNFSDHEGVTVLTVTCLPSASPVFVKDGQIERFFVRYGPSTQELSGQAAQDFIRKRF